MSAVLEPKVLKWAREQARMTEASLARKIGVEPDDVAHWEATGDIPEEAVGAIAENTRIPFGFLFLDKPPQRSLPIADFRSVSNTQTTSPSQDLLDVIYEVQLKQNWYREYRIANDEPMLGFVGRGKRTDKPENTAIDIADTLSIGPKINVQSDRFEDALRATIEALEDAGILFMRTGYAGGDTHRKLSVDEFRGIAISDPYAPVVFVNGADAPSAQMFTIAHEVAHIWLNSTGLSNLNKTYPAGIDIEVFCNAVAAETLLPLKILRTWWSGTNNDNREVERIAKHFKVSRIVVARRALDAGFFSKEAYANYYRNATIQRKPSSGGVWYLNQQYRNSKRLSVAIIQDARNGRTTYSEAMHLLGIKKTDTYRKYAESLNVES